MVLPESQKDNHAFFVWRGRGPRKYAPVRFPELFLQPRLPRVGRKVAGKSGHGRGHEADGAANRVPFF